MLNVDLGAEIRRRAYEIWESEGRPDGRQRVHWIRAEAEFREQFQPSARHRRSAPRLCSVPR